MSDKENEIFHTIALTQIPEIGCITAQKLIDAFGSASAIFQQKKSTLSAEGISDNLTKSILSGKEIALQIAEKEMRFIEKNNISVFLKNDKLFPKRLTECLDAPILLYGKGNLNLNPKYSVAIVGTRKYSEYGVAMTSKIVEELSEHNEIQIISGLAAGIDTFAHRSALKHNLSTIGVLGHGLQTIYPANNKKLAISMQETGGILSEYTSTTIGIAHNFPRRNRIIAGMADAIVVVEAHEKGGALITATIGFSYNRDVFAVPGRIGDKASEGCNNLIQFNKAALVTSGEDIIKMMMWDDKPGKNTMKAKQIQLMLDLSKEEQAVVNALQENVKLNIDELQIITSLNIATLSKTLLTLEFKGIINCLPGKRYVLSL
jgi:DNA processing protein